MFGAGLLSEAGAVDDQDVFLQHIAALESGDPLQQLARATGGTYFHNSNDLLQGLKRVFADSREYYVLAYVPKNASSDGTFRAIRVQVKGNGLKVRSKPGYWATEK